MSIQRVGQAALAIAAGACAAEPVATEPAEEATPQSVVSWTAAMEAMSVGMPASLVSSDISVDPAAADKTSRGDFFAVPIPRVDPALGNGLVGAAAYIFKLDRDDAESPPSVIGAGAMWMDSGSWGGGLGGKFYIRQDRFRLLAGLAYADLRYDLFVTPADGGSEMRIPLNQEGYGGTAHAQFRIAKDSYLGVRGQLGKLGTALRGEDFPQLPSSIEDEIGFVIQANSLGPTFALDTRDNAYYPRVGVALDASIDVYFEAIDSEESFSSYAVNYRQYMTVREHDVLAWQAYLCATGGDPPFFLECQVGPNSLLRGYSFGKYRGAAMLATQAEYRWQLRPRWIVAMFAGAAQVAEKFDAFELDENLYAGGVGLRFVVEPKNGVTLRVDYAVGDDGDAVYVSVGEAF